MAGCGTFLALLCVATALGYWFMLPRSVSVVTLRRGPAVYATGTVERTVMAPIGARIVTPEGGPGGAQLPRPHLAVRGHAAETDMILRQNEHALLLPAAAVQQDTVWRVGGGRLSPRKVTVGAKGASDVEILDGIADNDRIVAAPASGLRAGERIRPNWGSGAGTGR